MTYLVKNKNNFLVLLNYGIYNDLVAREFKWISFLISFTNELFVSISRC